MCIVLIFWAILYSVAEAIAAPAFVKDDRCDGHETNVLCGTVDVPENQVDDTGPNISLDVYVLPAEGDDPAPDPIVYLQGGPGSQSINSFWTFVAMTELRQKREIVIVNQRGTSIDAWLCPKYELDEALLIAGDINVAESNRRIAGAIKDCYAEARENGQDPAQYTNHANAQDFKDIRLALGYDQWNLWGTSYGTALAQELLKVDEDGIRSVVMDSVVPLDTGWAEGIDDHHRVAFEALNKDCQTDVACARRFGDLFELRFEAIKTLSDHPIVFDEGIGNFEFVDDSIYETYVIGADRDLHLNDHDLAGYIFSFLYTDYYSPIIPLLLDRVVARDKLFLDKFIGELVGGKASTDTGVFFSVACRFPMPSKQDVAEEIDRNRDWLNGISQVEYMADICAELGLPAVDPGQLELPTSDKPALIITGDRDPVTPKQYAERLAGNLPNSQLVTFADKSHAPGYSMCGFTLLKDFFDRPFKTKVRNCDRTGSSVAFVSDIIGTKQSVEIADTLKDGFWDFATVYTSLIFAFVFAVLGSLAMIISVAGTSAGNAPGWAAVASRASLAIGSALAVGMMGWFYLSALSTVEQFPIVKDLELGIIPLGGPWMVWGVPASLGAIVIALLTTYLARRRRELPVTDAAYHLTLVISAGWLCAFLVFYGAHPVSGWDWWQWGATSLNLKPFFY